jgi:thiol-disulfide isomerase/thioredoxin
MMNNRAEGLTILFIACLLLVPAAAAQADLALAPGDAAPPMRGRTANQEFFITDYGEYSATVVNFWATWCEPCKEEMPALQRLHEEYGGGLQIVSVLHDNATDEEVKGFLDALGISYPCIRAHRGYSQKWKGLSVLPTTFLIDGKGVIRRRYVGATAEQIKGMVYDVEAMLRGEPLGPFVMPETPAISTEEDRLRQVQQERKEQR